MTIADRQAELDALTRGLASSAAEQPSPVVVWQEAADDQLTETEQRQLAHWKTQPGNFKRYYEGDASLWTGSDKLVNSKSEADFVLVLMLLSRTQDNVERVKRLFRASGLFDPEKTDRLTGHDPKTHRPITYLEMSIYNALKKRERR